MTVNFDIRVRATTPADVEKYDAVSPDTAVIEIDGVVVGACDDYGTVTWVDHEQFQPVARVVMEEFLAAASTIYTEAVS